MESRRIVVLLIAFVAVFGFSCREDARPPRNLDKNEIEMIALEEVVRRTGCDAGQLQVEAEPDGKAWAVLVSRVPAMPGGFWHVDVAADGTISNFLGGE